MDEKQQVQSKWNDLKKRALHNKLRANRRNNLVSAILGIFNNTNHKTL